MPLQRLQSRASILGVDTPIRRALPHRERRMVGAWCFLDHAGPTRFPPGQGMHVGAHPHIGLQTFTWMIEGEVIHRDSLGHEQTIQPGQVNLMTAGRGIAHTEDSASDGAALHLAQLWIALPDAERHIAPAFENFPELPRLTRKGWAITVLVGEAFGASSPVPVHSPLLGLDLVADAPALATLPLDPRFEYAFMVLRGEATVEGEVLAPGEWLYAAPGLSTVDLRCAAPCQLLLLGGPPFGEDVLLWWNFVGRTQEEIEAARADWLAGSPRFGSVRPGCPAGPLAAPSLEGVRLRP
jgi:redox-sensitive bicupin YhaK (pirin superfamily)